MVSLSHAKQFSTKLLALGENLADLDNTATARDNLGVAIGTDVLAEQTIGIANNNLLEVDDAGAASGQYSRFTANGLEGRTEAEFKADFNLEIDIDVQAYDANTTKNDVANTFTANQTIDTTGSPAILNVRSDQGTDNVTASLLNLQGENSANTVKTYGRVLGRIINAASSSEEGELWFYAMQAGSLGLAAILGAGLQIGFPTGGDKGAGTINCSGDIYKNNTAYTSPDYVFEYAYKGKVDKYKDNPGAKEYKGLLPLKELGAYTEKHLRLPNISDAPMGAFERSDKALEKIEELTLYILELHKRIVQLETTSGV